MDIITIIEEQGINNYYYQAEFCKIGPFKTEVECRRHYKLYRESNESQDKFEDFIHAAFRGDLSV